MANVINTTIRVNADTSSAKASLQDLQSQLQNLASVPVGVDATGLQSAKNTILELGQNLRTAMNPNTGKLDLSVFSRQLKEQNRSILDYKNALFSMGTQGQQAFLSLANSIAAAEAPTNRLNAKLIKFGQTIKNTINWQLSSMMIHGVMGQIQGAINYAEKLNQSLNNIQIITGQNNEKMAEFAKQANQTARQLSTTTTEYTNASLIYYQQGLNDKQVAERTETTLKMANVTRQSAQEVSNQMTAIWNNFAEGTGNLEHYADVITALGAATASSSAEISAGLNKFAAIGKTVGLSYDYATTALATIIATTRQSADTVGTGLRTLFSRLEGLSLGKTLEDGVNLNKYSSALAKVGVNIQDQYGQIKDMDQILDELGAKWGTISKEQQIALAQTVGGVRQYTNLIALMDNWQFFQRNLQVAQGADGTLQTQAERYAEGWEAARKRVRTATEGIYDALIDDQAIIKVTNVFAGFLDVINGLVAGFGGLKGIIPIVGALLMNSFAKNMPSLLNDIGNNFRVLTGRGARDMTNMQGNLTGILQNIQANSTDEVYKAQIQKIIDTNYMNRSLAMNSRRMSEADQEVYKFKIAAREAENDAYIIAAQQRQQNVQQYTKLLQTTRPENAISAEKISEALKVKGSYKSAEVRTEQSMQTALGKMGRTTLALEKRKQETGYKNLETLIQQETQKLRQSNLATTESNATRKRIKDLQKQQQDYIAQEQKDFDDAKREFQEASQKHTTAKTRFIENQQILNEARQEADKADELLEKSGISRSELLKGYDLKDKLQGRAITEQNIKEFRAGGVLLSQDRDIIQKANEGYFKSLYQNQYSQGFLSSGLEKIESFQKESASLFSLDDKKKLDQAAFTKKAEEFATNWTNAVNSSGLDQKIKDSLQLKASDLIPDQKALDGDIDNFATQLEQKLSSKKTEITNKLKELGLNEGQITETLTSLGFTETPIAQVQSNGQAAGALALSSGMLPRAKEPEEAKPTQALSTSLTQVASAAMSLYSAFQSASNAVEVFSDTTKNGLSEFGSILSTITSTLMAGGMTGNALKGLGVGSKAGLIGLAISIAAMIAGTIGGLIEQDKISKQKDAQSLVEQGQTALDRLETVAELKKSQENLINAYNQTAKDLKKGQATQAQLAAAQEELIQALTQTAEGYSNAEAIASVLAGEMDQAQDILDYNRAEQIREDKAIAQAGLSNFMASLNNIPLKTYRFNGMSYSGLGMNYVAEPQVAQILRQYSSSFIQDDTTNDFLIPTAIKNKTASQEQIYSFILDAEAAYNQMLTAGLTGNGVSTLGDIVSYFKNYKEFYEQIRALNIEELMLGQSTEIENIGRANEEITDIQSYINYRKNAQNNLAKAYHLEKGTTAYDEMVKALDAELSTVAAVTNNDLGNLQYIYQGIQGVIDYQKSRVGEEEINETQLTNWLADAYSKYGNAIFELGMQVVLSPDANSLEESLGSYLDLLQLTADRNKIKIQMELAKDFDLDENSTASAWGKFGSELDKEAWQKAIGDEFLTFNDDGSIKGFNYAAFSALTDEIRQNYMDQYYDYLENTYYSPGGILDQEIAERERLLTDETNAESIISRKNAAQEAFDTSYNKGLAGAHGNIAKDTITNKYSNIEAYYAAKDSGNQEKISAFDTIFTPATRKALDENREEVEATVQAYKDLLGIEQEESAAQKKNDEARAERDAWDQVGFRNKLAREAEAQGINYDEVQQYAAALRETQSWQEAFADAQDNIAEASERAALSILETENAIASIASKYSEWNTILSSNASQLKKQAVYDEVAKKIKQLLIPTGQVTVGFAKFADNMGWVYKAGQGDKEAILEMGQALYEYSHIQDENIKQQIESAETSEELKAAQDAMHKQTIADLQELYDKTNQTASAEQDLTTVTEFLQTAQEGQAFSTEAQAAAQRLYAAEFQKAINQGMDAPQALQAASDAMNQIGADMPTPELKTLSAGESADVSRTDIEVTSEGEGDLKYSEGETTTVTNTSDTDISYLDWSGKGSGSAQTPTNAKNNGGGGGGGKKKKDHKKPDTGTRYHTIKAKQANNNQNKQEVNRQKERAFGAEKIKQAQKEIDLQKESLELQRQYIDEITDYLAGDRKNMEDAFKGLGISLNIDDNGVITNFREVEEELLRQENELIDQYNDGPLDDEAYQEAQKKIDEAREYLKIYEETRDLYEEQMTAMIELLDGLQDQLLELTKTKIEIQIDISDEKLDWLEYMLEKIDDDAYQAAEAIAFLGDKTGETLNRIDIYQAGLEEILGRKGFSLDDLDSLTDLDLASANFTQAEIDQIREWKSELMDANKELLKMREEVINKVIDGFDKLNEKVQNSYDNFNQYNDVLEKYKEITDLLGLRLNQQNKELLDSLGKATLANAQNQAASAKAIYETAKQANEDAQRTYQEMVQRYGENSPEAQQWENLINTTQDALDEAQNNWLDAWNNALQIAQDIYINHIEQITKTFEEQVSGLFGSLDYLQSAFDRADQVGTEYLQDFEKLYELNKLNRDIQKEIDDSNNIRDKQALKKLQKEINDLQAQGVQLSQYDVDALRKKFELEQARQALEDARNDKSEVRLQRDANGNWGYVYTAAEDATKEAEQEYENKLYEYQKLNDDYIKELQSRVLETQTQYKEALAEIYNDTTLTDEQRQARIDELNAWKDAELAYFEDQLNNALQNQQDTLDLYYKIYGDSQAALADSWEETTLKMLTGADSVEEYINNIQQAMLDMLNNSANALSDYNNDVDDTNEAAGVNTEEYATHVIEAMDEIGEASEMTQEQIAALAETLMGEFTDALAEAVKWEDEYANKMKAAIEQNEKFIQSLNEMIARLAIIESNDPELKIARANYMLAEANHEKFVQNHGDVYDADWEKAKQSWQEFLDKYADAAQYDTGGYTGSWGSEGRMAVLHEKENVFNAEDTERLLNAAQLLKTIDISAKTFAAGLGNILLPQIGALAQTLDQNVHIDASFPSVTDHNEIELAFDNLINKASQYANRKNMSSMTFQDMYTSKF